ncbi:helix-turn-helix transcriptional regulator [Fusobacterium perfoetens]|uniref:helix-turn-helix domain-containing protein n=1 Tax=Fusobacterium perfoetens TaxID=852 RepID=UPI001F31CDCE|nr:helix-turn-helix transcriptional regulator [Fusobacterium perfoetens]MCF2625280.1 helix-turn-helix transcriptional regulator [Fusobacterium perfoetens]
MEKLSIVLKQLRESRNMTLEELAKKSGVGRGTIGDIETGKNKSTVKTLGKLATALKLTNEEKNKLDSAFLGRNITEIDSRILELNKRELSQYEKTMEEASLFFNDETVSEEDKQKMVLAISKLFFESKEMNKDKYRKNKDK